MNSDLKAQVQDLISERVVEIDELPGVVRQYAAAAEAVDLQCLIINVSSDGVPPVLHIFTLANGGRSALDVNSMRGNPFTPGLIGYFNARIGDADHDVWMQDEIQTVPIPARFVVSTADIPDLVESWLTNTVDLSRWSLDPLSGRAGNGADAGESPQ